MVGDSNPVICILSSSLLAPQSVCIAQVCLALWNPLAHPSDPLLGAPFLILENRACPAARKHLAPRALKWTPDLQFFFFFLSSSSPKETRG